MIDVRLGIGAGNNGAEHHSFGYPFLPSGERLAQTEEAIRIIRALWCQSPATFHGKHYSIEEAFSSPLPDRWETRDLSAIPVTGGTLAVPPRLFEHQALLYTADRTPFSEVNETYSSAVLAFPPPAAPR